MTLGEHDAITVVADGGVTTADPETGRVEGAGRFAAVVQAPSAAVGPHRRPGGHSSGELPPLERTHRREPFLFGFTGNVRDIWGYRELLSQLVRKELKVKYKDSALGMLWTLVRPILQLLIYSVAIGVFLGSSKNIPQFGIYLYTGLLAWNTFTDITAGCTGSIIGNAGLVKKVYLPRELFPLSVVGASIVNFFFQAVVLLGAYAVARQGPGVGQLYLVPLAFAVMIVFATAVGLMLASANVYLRDVTYLVDVGLMLWFWMTPIVYDWTKVHMALNPPTRHLHWLYELYLANPMSDVVLAFQRALWPAGHTAKGAAFYYGGNLSVRLWVLLAVSLVLLWLGQRIFARAQGNFAQEL